MDSTDLSDKAERLRALHERRPLVLPNVWDPASAWAFAAAGFPALATSSSAVAASIGYEDHEGAPADEMLAAVGRITRSVDVPVTADIESGYGLEPGEIVEGLAAAGAAGCNLEDTDHSTGAQRPADEQAERLAAVVAAARDRDLPLVVNARVDTYLTGDPDDADAIRRANAYLEAGADCAYPIGWLDEVTTTALVEGIEGPVNVLRWQDGPPIDRLGEIGVARVTFGGGLHRQVMETVERLAKELHGG
jgi:2-methylisocitrate lyase-like PEP mutase family enzyme